MDRTRFTIAAIATPAGSGGIGIIKISGPEAPGIVRRLFRRASSGGQEMSPLSENQWESHRFNYGYVVDPDTGEVLDEVMAVLMRSPRSYTREDVVEIHLHSGPAVLKAVLERVLAAGAILAEPGEFTRRAFLSGRIDLTRAEGVLDLINARTDRSRAVAAVQVRGEMGNRVSAIRQELLRMLTELEAAIDFPEEVGESVDPSRLLSRMRTEVIDPLTRLVMQYDHAHILREGTAVVIAGRPNVGKSSLMNRLMGQERAIVTAIPGTTRDAIEDSLSIHGIPVVLTDTAGLHKTEDPVERIGIERALARIQEADVVLWVTEANRSTPFEDVDLLRPSRFKKIIWVINKSDLCESLSIPEPPGEYASIPRVAVSAKENTGVDSLRAMIAEMSLNDTMVQEHPMVPNLRQKKALEAGLHHAESVAKGLEAEIPVELIDIDLQSAIDALGEVIGITFREDILDRIFSRFCIGK